MQAIYENQCDLHDDLRSLSEGDIKKELEYWVKRTQLIASSISVGVIRFIDGQWLEIPLHRLAIDQTGAIERIEAIIRELENRKIP